MSVFETATGVFPLRCDFGNFAMHQKKTFTEESCTFIVH